jgi:hypothetical protein
MPRSFRQEYAGGCDRMWVRFGWWRATCSLRTRGLNLVVCPHTAALALCSVLRTGLNAKCGAVRIPQPYQPQVHGQRPVPFRPAHDSLELGRDGFHSVPDFRLRAGKNGDGVESVPTKFMKRQYLRGSRRREALMVGHLDDTYGSSKCPTGHLSLNRIEWFQYGRDFGPSV